MIEGVGEWVGVKERKRGKTEGSESGREIEM